MLAGVRGVANPVEQETPFRKNVPLGYRDSRVHASRMADAILNGKAMGKFTEDLNSGEVTREV